jgi:hypothetical protein
VTNATATNNTIPAHSNKIFLSFVVLRPHKAPGLANPILLFFMQFIAAPFSVLA